jgi:hypothetical protein
MCGQTKACATTPAQRKQYRYFIMIMKPGAQIAGLIVVDEDLDVRANPVLLVDYAKAESGVAPVQLAEQLAQRRAFRFHLVLSTRV